MAAFCPRNIQFHGTFAIRGFCGHFVIRHIDLDTAGRRYRHGIRCFTVHVDQIGKICHGCRIQVHDPGHAVLFIYRDDDTERPRRSKSLCHAHNDRAPDPVVSAKGCAVCRHGSRVIIHNNLDRIVFRIIVRTVPHTNHIHMRLKPHHGIILISFRGRNIEDHIKDVILYRIKSLLLRPVHKERTDLFFMAGGSWHFFHFQEVFNDMLCYGEFLFRQFPVFYVNAF